MINDPSKSARQEQFIKTWLNNKGCGTGNLVTRFGKTEIAKRISDRTLAKNPDFKILALVPNDITRQNLQNNLDHRIEICTPFHIIANFDKYRSEYHDIIIVDEIHKFTHGKSTCCLKLDSKFKLGLTGDKLRPYDRLYLAKHGFPVIDTITEEEALKNNWISDFIEYNIPVELEDYKRDKYVAISNRIFDTLATYKGLYKKVNIAFNAKVFTGDVELMYALYSGTKFKQGFKFTMIPGEVIRKVLADSMGWKVDMELDTDFNRQLNTFFNPSQLFETSKLFNSMIRDRNNLIINSRNKIEMVLQILERNPVPTIIFNESTNMATDITNSINNNNDDNKAIEYHSNIESRYIINPKTDEYYCHANGNPIKFGATRLKKLAIEGIKNGTFKYIITAKALNEGVDIPILSQVITTGGTINPSTHLQRTARGKTIDPLQPDKVTKIINVYIKDFEYNGEIVSSRDEQKLRLRQDDTVVIWTDNINDIFGEHV